MTCRRRCLIFLAVTACTPPSVTNQSSPLGRNALRAASTPPLPRSLPGYEVRDTSIFEEPNSGVMYRYQGPGTFVPDVFLYPVPPQGALCQGTCRSEVAEAEVGAFRQSIPTLIARGYADSIVDFLENSVQAPAQSWVGNGYHLRFRLVRRGASRDSHLYVFAGLESFVKFRATFSPGTVPDSLLDSFVQTILIQAPPPYTCAAGYRTEPGISVSVTLAETATELASAVGAAFERLGYTLDYQGPHFGLWRTLPSFEWPAGTDSEDWHGASSPGLTLFAMLTEKQDSIVATFSSQAVCNQAASSRNKKDETTVLQTLSALQLTTAFDSALKAQTH
jgi:hypothetical protein